MAGDLFPTTDAARRPCVAAGAGGEVGDSRGVSSFAPCRAGAGFSPVGVAEEARLVTTARARGERSDGGRRAPGGFAANALAAPRVGALIRSPNCRTHPQTRAR